MNPRRVAIACQGGGSHTAFTAGVLKQLLREDALRRYRVVGLSGTSGGAVCALLAWYALINDDPTGAGRLLDDFWADNSASAPHVAVDLTRKQVARNGVTWTVRTARRGLGHRVEGCAEAAFAGQESLDSL